MSDPSSPDPRCFPLVTLDAAAPRRLAAEADELRTAARALVAHAAELPELLRTVADFDRPDVWQGGRADQFRLAMVDVTRRLCSPSIGAAGELLEAAARFERRAAWLDTLAVEPAPDCG
jgi:hypothetical protein